MYLKNKIKDVARRLLYAMHTLHIILYAMHIFLPYYMQCIMLVMLPLQIKMRMKILDKFTILKYIEKGL